VAVFVVVIGGGLRQVLVGGGEVVVARGQREVDNVQVDGLARLHDDQPRALLAAAARPAGQMTRRPTDHRAVGEARARAARQLETQICPGTAYTPPTIYDLRSQISVVKIGKRKGSPHSLFRKR